MRSWNRSLVHRTPKIQPPILAIPSSSAVSGGLKWLPSEGITLQLAWAREKAAWFDPLRR